MRKPHRTPTGPALAVALALALGLGLGLGLGLVFEPGFEAAGLDGRDARGSGSVVEIDPDTGRLPGGARAVKAETPSAPALTVATVPASTTTGAGPAPQGPAPDAPAPAPATTTATATPRPAAAERTAEMTATVSVRYHSENTEHNTRYPEDEDHLVELVFTVPEGWTARWSHKGHSCGGGYRNPNPYRHSPGHEHGRVWAGHCWPLDWSTNTVNAPGAGVLVTSEPVTEVCERGEGREVRVQFLPPAGEREYIHGRRPGDPMRLGVQYPPMGAKWLLNHVLTDVSWCFTGGAAEGFRTR